ncbi:MAG: hypothetical protein Kow00108_23490 [Calditrichia bacterium]
MIIIEANAPVLRMLDANYEDGVFKINKIYENQSDLDFLSDDLSYIAKLIENEIANLGNDSELATEEVAILVSNKYINKYVFVTEPDGFVDAKKLLANELSVGLDVHFQPSAKAYYLIESIEKSEKDVKHIVLEISKIWIQRLQSLLSEMTFNQVSVQPSWIGLYNFITEFPDLLKNVLIFEKIDQDGFEVTAIRDSNVFSVFRTKITDETSFSDYFANFIQFHYSSVTPSYLNLSQHDDTVFARLNLPELEIEEFSSKIVSASKINLHQVKSFFSLLGILK